MYAASVSVTQSTLSHNDAAANGGCLNTTGGASIVNSNFMDNEAETDAGGAIASLGGTLTVTESTFGGTNRLRRERLRLGWSDLHGVDRGHQGLDVHGQPGRGFPRARRRDLQPSGDRRHDRQFDLLRQRRRRQRRQHRRAGHGADLRNNTILSNPTIGADIAHTSGSGTVTLANNIIEDFNNALGKNCDGAMNDGGYNVVSGDLPTSTCPTGGTNVAQTPLMVTPIDTWGGPTRRSCSRAAVRRSI